LRSEFVNSCTVERRSFPSVSPWDKNRLNTNLYSFLTSETELPSVTSRLSLIEEVKLQSKEMTDGVFKAGAKTWRWGSITNDQRKSRGGLKEKVSGGKMTGGKM